VARWQDANEDHYLYCKDSYSKRREQNQFWYESNLETLARMKLETAQMHEANSLLMVLGMEFSTEIAKCLAAHNAVRRGFASEDISEEEIAALERDAGFAYYALIKRVREAHEKV